MSRSSRKKIIAPEASAENRETTLEDQTAKDKDEMTYQHQRALARQAQRLTLISLSDKVAGDTVHIRNRKFPGADQVFESVVDVRMRFVSKFYPYANGGELYVDEPRTESEIQKCHEKRKVMKKLKLRYIVIEPQHTTPEGRIVPGTTLQDLWEQLEQ